MDSEELLAQLADIHLPEAVSFWPPAPGWWVLALLASIATFFAVRSLLARRRQRLICQHALAELARCYARLAKDELADQQSRTLRFINEFNSVLRRVALVHFPKANVASLGGAAWVDFIREKGDSSLLNSDIAAALSYGRFQTECDVDVDAMNTLGQAWITSLYLGSVEARSSQQGSET